jgi:methylmalonyl-CoA/ethylmalonyl-CoA epimerase
MKLGRLNHIGVATPSIADSIVFYRNVMGATKIHMPFDLPDQGVKVCFGIAETAEQGVGKPLEEA